MFGAGLIQAEPTQKNWSLLIEVVQRVANYPSQDELDLMRLMGRTHSYAEKQDYLEYIQAADARRLPGEVLDVIAAGIASGMLSTSDQSVADAKAIAAGRSPPIGPRCRACCAMPARPTPPPPPPRQRAMPR